MAFTIDTETQKITFGVVSDLTNDAISIPLADQFGVSEDFNDDFSGADNWTDNGTNVQVNTTTDVIDWNLVTDFNGTYIDLGVISDSAWVLRFKIDINSQSGTDNKLLLFGLWDNNVFDNTTSQDFLRFILQKFGAPGNFIYISNGNGTVSKTATNDQFVYHPGLEVLYVELRRISATSFQINLFSDPDFTALIESITQVISSGITGLRYLKAQVWDAGGLATMSGTIDNIQFWDGISTPVIRSDNWRARFKLDITNLNNGGNSIDKRLYIGLFDEDATSGADNTQDGYLLLLTHDNTDNLFLVRTPDSQQPRLATDDATFSTAPSVTTRWIELRKDNSSQTTTSIYSDATFTILVESEVVAGISGSDNLRYLKLMNDVGFTGAGAIDGTFDDFTFTDLSDLTGTNTETFLIDAIIKEIQIQVFTVDAIKKGIFDETFTIDGIPFAPPAILYLIDARLIVSDFGDFRDIGDLILRVLTENPSGLTGDEIVDEIRIITEMETEWGFLGKKHRIKGWINYLFKNGVIENDNSDPDWWQSVWTLV